MTKQFYLLLLIFLYSCSLIFAQDELKQDAIYMKNKKVYYGTILSDEFGIIKMHTTDDNGNQITITIQRYDVKKVEKNQDTKKVNEQNIPVATLSPDTNSNIDPIGLKQSDKSNIFIERQVLTKHDPSPIFTDLPTFQPSLTRQGGVGYTDYDNPYRRGKRRRLPHIWVRDITGFRGFLETGYMWGMGKNKYSYFEASKSIGFQFTPFFYLGVGASMHLSNSFDVSGGYPLFINARFNLTDRNTWNPFISVKGGYSVGDMHGINSSVTAGTSIVLKNKKLAFNIGLSYTYFDAQYKEWDRITKKNITYKPDLHSIGIKLEFEYFIGR